MFLNNALFLAILANVLWGIAPVLFKLALNELTPLQVVIWKLIFSALLSSSSILLLFKNKKHLFSRFQKSQIEIFAIPIISLGTFYIQTFCLNKIPASLYVLGFGLVPVLSLFQSGKKQFLRNLSILFIGFLGLIIFSNASWKDLNTSINSYFWLVLSVGGWMSTLWLMMRTNKLLNSSEFTSLTNVFGLFLILPQLFKVNIFSNELKNSYFSYEFQIRAYILVFISSLFLFLALILFHKALKKAPQLTILSQYLEPFFGVIGAIFILNETIKPIQLIGLILIFSALALQYKYT